MNDDALITEAELNEKIEDGQTRWLSRRGLPNIKGEFGLYPTSILVLATSKKFREFLQDNAVPFRHMGTPGNNPRNLSNKASTFPVAVSWFATKYWSPPGGLVLDPFGNRANIGLVANLMGRRVILNDIVPVYCDLMREAGRRRPNKKTRLESDEPGRGRARPNKGFEH